MTVSQSTTADIAIDIRDSWGSGFAADLTVSANQQLSGWTIELEYDGDIVNIWNATVVLRIGNRYVISDAGYNAALSAGATTTFGFEASGMSENVTPISINDDLFDGTMAGPEPVDPMEPADDASGDDMGGGSDPGNGDAGGDTGGGDTGPFVGGGVTYSVGETSVVTGFDPTRDVLDLGPNSIHNQIPVDTAEGFMMVHMFSPGQSLLVEGVWLADLHPENFAPIADAHLQQDLSAILAYEDGSGLVRPNTVYVRSHQEGLVETVDFDPATDKISFFYLSVRGDGLRNFAVEDTAQGARFFNPLNGQSLTLNGVSFADLDSSHFEWRANQLEDNVAGRIGLLDAVENFQIVSENVFSGKSVAMAGGVDRAPYHSQPEYTGTPISDLTDDGSNTGNDMPDYDHGTGNDMPGTGDGSGNDMPDTGGGSGDGAGNDMPVADHGGHDHGGGMFTDITEYGTFHGSSSHTDHGELEGGRTAITTEAMLAYNGLRDFLGLADVTQEEVGSWAFAQGMTNNTQPYGQDLMGVGLWYAMQGAKVGWISDDQFDPKILADIQREARLGDPANVMNMIEQYGHEGFASYLTSTGLDGHFIETLKMEPHYGGWMHGRTHGWMNFPEGGAIAHDVNHLTVLSHDQTQPFMNDTFDWPQWPALNVTHQDVIDYFQAMVVLGDPLGDALPVGSGSPDTPDDFATAPQIMPPTPLEPFAPMRQFITAASEGVMSTIDVHDPDLANGDTLQFQLVGEDADHFTIDAETGIVSLTEILTDPFGSFDGDAVYEVIVWVSDSAGMTDVVELDYLFFVGG